MFSIAGGLLSYALLRLQGYLPFNPQHFNGSNMTPDLSFNTAVSFMTNTNWQSYSPETNVSYFGNMVPLAIHNWMSSATGIAVAIALVRGFARRSMDGLGSFWADVTRASLYVLLPICIVFSLLLVWQGVPQNFSPYVQAHTLEGSIQSIAQGPVASRDERRRVFQCEFVASIREPDTVHQPAAGPGDLSHPGGTDGNVREDGRESKTGVDDFRCDVAAIRDWRLHLLLGGSKG
jgi:hypothetical protein